ncbi:MAG: hypothetical protein OEX03_13280 [Gammaproteobacteria bacterium]|nr:hypothetical protein [Gammaproteobacteria bacterium]
MAFWILLRVMIQSIWRDISYDQVYWPFLYRNSGKRQLPGISMCESEGPES